MLVAGGFLLHIARTNLRLISPNFLLISSGFSLVAIPLIGVALSYLEYGSINNRNPHVKQSCCFHKIKMIKYKVHPIIEALVGLFLVFGGMKSDVVVVSWP